MLPEEVNILGLTYKIQEVEVVNKEIPRFGEINFQTQTIKIDKTLLEEKKQHILIHEVFHGICELLGLNEIGDNETVVQSIATALYHFLSTNTIFS